MKNLMKGVIIFLLFCAIMAASVYGVVFPSNTQVTAVGAMQIAPFSDGISLFQDYRRLYYRFSPFNDYVIDSLGNRSTLISIQEIQNNQFTTNIHRSRVEDIFFAVNTYLTNGTPNLRFETSSLTANYHAVTNGNKTTVQHRISYDTPQNFQKIGTTLAYHGDDIVFDRMQNVYNYWDTNDLEIFEKTYGLKPDLKNERLQIDIPNNEIFITNPRAAFVIVVRANDNQTLRINRDAKLIELEETVQTGTEFTGEVMIEIVQDPREVF